MKTQIIFSLFITATVLLLIIGGVTTAWFTDEASPSSTASMVTGEMDFEIDTFAPEPSEENNNNNGDNDSYWKKGEEWDFSWSFKNTGTKRAFFRAKLKEQFQVKTDSAWGASKTKENDKHDYIFPDGQWRTYFKYDASNDSEKQAVLIAGNDHREVGEISVQIENEDLIVEVETKENLKMSKTDLAVVDKFELIQTTPSNKPVPGQFPFSKEFEQLESSFKYSIPMDGEYPEKDLEGEKYDWDGEELYIALHADIFEKEDGSSNLVNWEAADNCNWEKGEEEDGEWDGYWYYCQPVLPGDSVKLNLIGTFEENGFYEVYIEGEALQASPKALAEKWTEAPCNNEK